MWKDSLPQPDFSDETGYKENLYKANLAKPYQLVAGVVIASLENKQHLLSIQPLSLRSAAMFLIQLDQSSLNTTERSLIQKSVLNSLNKKFDEIEISKARKDVEAVSLNNRAHEHIQVIPKIIAEILQEYPELENTVIRTSPPSVSPVNFSEYQDGINLPWNWELSLKIFQALYPFYTNRAATAFWIESGSVSAQHMLVTSLLHEYGHAHHAIHNKDDFMIGYLEQRHLYMTTGNFYSLQNSLTLSQEVSVEGQRQQMFLYTKTKLETVANNFAFNFIEQHRAIFNDL